MASSEIRVEVVAGEHAAGRVGRRVDEQDPGPRRDERGQLVDVEPELVLHPDGDRHRGRADEPGERFVDRVAGVGDDDLVARVDQAEDRVEHHALATDGHEDLRRIGVDALALRHVRGDRLTQRRDAGERRVMGLALVERALGRGADVGGRVEIGLADLEVDHRPALGRERAGAGADLEGALRPDGAHAGRDATGLGDGHGGPPLPYGSSERIAKVTLAGRSASRRMYQGYQASPYAMSVCTRYPSRASRNCSPVRIP